MNRSRNGPKSLLLLFFFFWTHATAYGPTQIWTGLLFSAENRNDFYLPKRGWSFVFARRLNDGGVSRFLAARTRPCLYFDRERDDSVCVSFVPILFQCTRNIFFFFLFWGDPNVPRKTRLILTMRTDENPKTNRLFFFFFFLLLDDIKTISGSVENNDVYNLIKSTV